MRRTLLYDSNVLLCGDHGDGGWWLSLFVILFDDVEATIFRCVVDVIALV